MRAVSAALISSLLCVGLLSGCGKDKAEDKAEGCTPRSDVKAADRAATKATFHTSMGDIHVNLLPDRTPKTVDNFIGLADGSKEWGGAKGQPLYDCTIFHRVIPDFMIQGGDPEGTGMGGPNYTIDDEFHADDDFNSPGYLAMANTSAPHSAGSQFFITVAPFQDGNGKYTIFGKVTDAASQKVANAISAVPTGGPQGTQPLTDVVLKSVTID